MRKLDIVPPPFTEGSPENGCMTRRAILATLAAAALTACSGTTIITTAAADGGGTGTDAGGDGTDAATGDDSSTPQPDGGGPPPTCPTDGNAGPVSSFAQGTWSANGDYIVGHDAGGLFAFSTRCTHQGCTIDAPSSTGATVCPCHGARFDGNGAVTQGPARQPLPHFALTVCNGMVYVDTSSTVAATTRTPAA